MNVTIYFLVQRQLSSLHQLINYSGLFRTVPYDKT